MTVIFILQTDSYNNTIQIKSRVSFRIHLEISTFLCHYGLSLNKVF